MLFRRAAAATTGAALAMALAAAVSPSAGAQTVMINENIPVTYTCATPDTPGLNIGGGSTFTNTVSVSYPETVDPGQTFAVTLQPGVMARKTQYVSRLTYDIKTSDNIEGMTTSLSGGSGYEGTAALVGVDPNTKVTTAGTDTLRLWGGASGTYGTNTGTSVFSPLNVNANPGNLQLPKVTMNITAEDGAGEVVVGLAGAGAAAGDSAANTQFGYVRGNTATGTLGRQINCAVSANAGNLITVQVGDDENPVEYPSTTTIVGGDKTADSSQPVTLSAKVAAPGATATRIMEGTVTFKDADSGEVLGSANPNNQGTATLTHSFPRIPEDDPDVVRNIVAEYSGVPERVGASTSAAITLTLTPKPPVTWDTPFTVVATVGQLTAESQAVSITANFTRPGLAYPEGTVAQLFRNDEPLGDPVPMPATGNSLTFTDEVAREQTTKPVAYKVELVRKKVDSDVWTGTTANPPTILVKGTGVSAPEPSTGSLQFGSLENAFTASLSELSGYDVAPLSSDNLIKLVGGSI